METGQTFGQIFEQAADALILHDVEGRIVDCNGEACRSLGYAREELLSLRVSDTATDLLAQERRSRWQLAVSSPPGPVAGTHLGEHRRKDGTTFPVEVRVSGVDHHGERLILASARDVTERVGNEGSLRLQQTLVRALTEASIDGILVISEERKILSFNRCFVEMWGIPEEVVESASDEDALGKAMERVVDPAGFMARVTHLYEHPEEDSRDEVRLKDGRTFDRYGASVKDEDGAYHGRVWYFRDITDRKQAEKILRESEERYRQAFEKNRAVKILVDPGSGAILDANAAASEYYGYPLEELKAKKIAEINTLPAERVAEEMALAQAGERGYFAFRHRISTGEVRDVEVHSSPIEMGGRTVLYSIVHDVTERKRAERQLRESEERHRLVSRATRDAIWDTDLLTGEQTWNVAAQAMLGYDDIKEGTREGWWEDRLHPDDRERVVQGIEGVLRDGGEVWSDEYRFRHADGAYLTIVDRGYVVRDEEGRPVRVIGSMLDITGRKRTEEDLRRAKEEADAASRAKSQFLANMSHEIRTPMNGVIGMTGLLLDTDLSPQQRRYAETVRGSGEVLLALLDDTLDFSKIEAGEVRIEAIDFDLRAVVKGAAAVFEERAKEKELELASFVEYDAPTDLRGDPFRIRQVLTNLLSNAVKFTEEGQVVLKVEHAEGGGDSATIRFEVTDTGIGITEEQRSRLFQPFSQADASTTRRYGGTGLGLAISGQLVELMGGEISVKSKPGVGSSFSFTVPLEKQRERGQAGPSVETSAPSPEPPPPMYRDDAKEPERSGVRVLVVEDTLTNQMVAVELLERRGYAADVVFNGAQAVDTLSRVPYAAVLMDIQMPEMDGYEATAEIRRREGGARRTPIIAMTAHALQGDREKALAAGMDDYLSKPVRPEQLDWVLERWVPERPPRVRQPQENAQPATDDVSAPSGSLDQSVLADLRLIQREGGGDIVERLVGTFNMETPIRLAALREAAERGEAHAFGRTAHALNGVCRSVGASRAASICLEMERLGDSGDLTRASDLLARLEEEFELVRVLLDTELSRI